MATLSIIECISQLRPTNLLKVEPSKSDDVTDIEKEFTFLPYYYDVISMKCYPRPE